MLALTLMVIVSASLLADDAPPPGVQQVKHQVTGLFCVEREADLAELMQTIPSIKLVSVDFPSSTAVFEYDAAKVFPGAKLDQIVPRFHDMLAGPSRGSFGIKSLATIPDDKLTKIEIPVAGLDCKACSFAAYNAIARVEGVERATASFKLGTVTAMIDPAKTNREALEKMLKERGVTLK